MEDALLFQLRSAVDKYMHHATLLEAAMAGVGTKDHLLVSRVIRYRKSNPRVFCDIRMQPCADT
jgi:hypothetical protein